MIEFEWHIDKANSNLLKHGVSFDEAKSVFYDIKAKMFADQLHSIDEDRFVLIGYSKNNRLIFVSYTERKDLIRIISARKATKNERLFYEKDIKSD